MYTSYYGFREKPFQIIHDPSRLFMSKGHADTYAHLEYALVADKGFVVVTGEPGSGKTALINLLIKEQGTAFKIGVLNPNDSHPEQLMTSICRIFGVSSNSHDVTEVIRVFRGLFGGYRKAGQRAVLIVDEAQDLTDEDLEQMRILANLETHKNYLIQIILVGRSGLKKKLFGNKTRDFIQRATVICHLAGLQRNEVGSYLRHRLQYAGGSHNLGLFDQEATESIYEHSRGVPKLVNIISDAALIYGYADELKTIGKDVVEEVVKDATMDDGIYPRPLSVTGKTKMVDRRMDKDIRWDIEKQVRVLENRIRRINQALRSRNSARSDKNEAVSELTCIFKKVENQLTSLLGEIKIFLS